MDCIIHSCSILIKKQYYAFPPTILKSVNIAINRLFPERSFLRILCIRLLPPIMLYRYMYLLPVKTEIDSRDRETRINLVPEITDLLRYLPTFEIFGEKA